MLSMDSPSLAYAGNHLIPPVARFAGPIQLETRIRSQVALNADALAGKPNPGCRRTRLRSRTLLSRSMPKAPAP